MMLLNKSPAYSHHLLLLLRRAAVSGRAAAVRSRQQQRLWLSSSSSSSSTVAPPKPPLTPPKPTPPLTPPTTQQLRIVAMRAAIPMVGFGFMDNIVMIQAGEAIDMSLGVAFGLSTLTAAGFGQCISDVAGFTCGGVVDAVVTKLKLPQHGLTMAQLDLKTSRLYHTLGGCIGVVTGCLLGMMCLLFMDTNRAERAKKAKELQSIFETVLMQGHDLLNAERATLWMLDDNDHDHDNDHNDNNNNNNNNDNKRMLWSRVATGTSSGTIIHAPLNGSLVGECVLTGNVINVHDVYQDQRFDKRVDEATGYRTRSVLCYPVRQQIADGGGNDDDDDDGNGGKIIGAIQIVNKKKTSPSSLDHPTTGQDSDDDADKDDGAVFTDNDVKLIKMLASHVACFIKIVRGTD